MGSSAERKVTLPEFCATVPERGYRAGFTDLPPAPPMGTGQWSEKSRPSSSTRSRPVGKWSGKSVKRWRKGAEMTGEEIVARDGGDACLGDDGAGAH